MSTVEVPLFCIVATPSTLSTVEVEVPIAPFETTLETPFVFEQPKPTYYLLDMTERDALLSLGPIAPARLVYIKRMHVVFQSLSLIQVTIAQRLDLPHYQATMPYCGLLHLNPLLTTARAIGQIISSTSAQNIPPLSIISWE
jgi:hypothetical protein